MVLRQGAGWSFGPPWFGPQIEDDRSGAKPGTALDRDEGSVIGPITGSVHGSKTIVVERSRIRYPARPQPSFERSGFPGSLGASGPPPNTNGASWWERRAWRSWVTTSHCFVSAAETTPQGVVVLLWRTPN